MLAGIGAEAAAAADSLCGQPRVVWADSFPDGMQLVSAQESLEDMVLIHENVLQKKKKLAIMNNVYHTAREAVTCAPDVIGWRWTFFGASTAETQSFAL
ncbi:MAG: hypothetical protein IJY40_00975 [Oscillospiraceae bacterium]|nr:hypothetical protein [Oscillospiraceae bacterium]